MHTDQHFAAISDDRVTGGPYNYPPEHSISTQTHRAHTDTGDIKTAQLPFREKKEHFLEMKRS